MSKSIPFSRRGKKGLFNNDMTECHQAIDRAISLNRKGE